MAGREAYPTQPQKKRRPVKGASWAALKYPIGNRSEDESCHDGGRARVTGVELIEAAKRRVSGQQETAGIVK